MTTFSEQFPIVFQALNIGFVQTLKLFFVTLIGAIPLGLIISFGSMSNWAPLGFLRPLLKNLPKNTKLTWWQRFQIWCYVDFKPIRIIVRFIIWVVRGTPLMLQLLVFYYFPGLVLGKNIWGGGEAGRFLASSIAFIFNYACYFSEIFRGGIQGVPKGQQEAGQVLGHDEHADLLQGDAAADGQAHRAAHVQRDYHAGQGHVPVPHHRPAGDHLGRSGVFEGLTRHFRRDLAAVLHGHLLSALLRRFAAAA